MSKPLLFCWVLVGLGLFGAFPLAGNYGFYLGSAVCVAITFALAYDIAFGRTGLLSFGHAMFFGVGAYASVLLAVNLGLGFWPLLLAATVIAGLFALLVGSVALQVTGHAFVVITVIFSAIVELFAVSKKGITNGEDGLSFDVKRAPLGVWSVDLSSPAQKYVLMLLLTTVVFLLVTWINTSSLGLAFRAVRENPRRAMLLGYPIQRYKLAAFTISGALSGLAGCMFSFLDFHVSAEIFQISVSISPLTSVLVGGAGTLLGPVIGAASIYLLTDYLRSLVIYADGAVGAILVATVLLAPDGIIGLLGRAAEWRQRPHRSPGPESGVPSRDEPPILREQRP